MSKDKIIGGAILAIAGFLIVFYTFWVLGGYIHAQIDAAAASGGTSFWDWAAWFPKIPGLPWELGVILPIWLVAVIVLAIAIWIGYSMLTTPPPVPLEELEEELEAEEAAEKEE